MSKQAQSQLDETIANPVLAQAQARSIRIQRVHDRIAAMNLRLSMIRIMREAAADILVNPKSNPGEVGTLDLLAKIWD